MNCELRRATINDAKEIWKMQKEAFTELFEKYQDYETNPANEPLEKIQDRLEREESYFYFIELDNVKVGAIRVIDYKDETKRKKISPLFILPQYRGKKIAQKAISLCEELHGESFWELDTILEERGNCYLYEKMGYHRTGETRKVNNKLTLIYYEK